MSAPNIYALFGGFCGGAALGGHWSFPVTTVLVCLAAALTSRGLVLLRRGVRDA